MPPATTQSRVGPDRAWLTYLALGGLMTTWAGFWTLLLWDGLRWGTPVLWCAVLTGIGLVISCVGLTSRPAPVPVPAKPVPTLSLRAVVARLTGGRSRLDPPQPAPSRLMHPHLRFRRTD
jgi:hypothetical protein